MSNTKEFPTAPDWSKAPGDCNFFAIDRNGAGYWFKDCPQRHLKTWYAGGWRYAGKFVATHWDESIQKRPNVCYKTGSPCKYDCSGLCKES